MNFGNLLRAERLSVAANLLTTVRFNGEDHVLLTPRERDLRKYQILSFAPTASGAISVLLGELLALGLNSEKIVGEHADLRCPTPEDFSEAQLNALLELAKINFADSLAREISEELDPDYVESGKDKAEVVGVAEMLDKYFGLNILQLVLSNKDALKNLVVLLQALVNNLNSDQFIDLERIRNSGRNGGSQLTASFQRYQIASLLELELKDLLDLGLCNFFDDEDLKKLSLLNLVPVELLFTQAVSDNENTELFSDVYISSELLKVINQSFS